MKLLLDEMYPPAIAEQLRDRGHEVEAVCERFELRGLADVELFDAARSEGRAIVTENIVDFVAIVNGFERRGAVHAGPVLVDPGTYPRGRPRTIGLMVSALDLLLRSAAGKESASPWRWL